MGIGFVLIVFSVLGAVCAAVAGVVLAVVVRRLLRSSPPAIRSRYVTAAALLPAAGVAYLLVAFVGYGLWCETFRGVDAGLGDTWRVPVVAGYSLVMIDTPDSAFLETPAQEQLFFGLSGIAVHGAFILGKTGEHSTFFLLDTSTRTTHTFETDSALFEQAKRLGYAAAPLQAPVAFYYAARWGAPDVIAAGVLGSVPLVATVFLLFRLFRTVRNQFALPASPVGT